MNAKETVLKPMEPCIGCPDMEIDNYGYLCDLACGKRAAWLNQMEGYKAGWDERAKWLNPDEVDRLEEAVQAGRKEVVEEIQKHNLYEKKNSHSFYHDGGISFETSESLDDRKWWQAKLKEWGER